MSSYVPALLRRAIAQRADSLYQYCLILDEDTYAGCQVEHIIAEKHGGITHESNLAFACAYCNRAKGTDIATLVPASGAISRLFNPRSDIWSHHFRINGVHIEGITEIGICTVVLLGFNRESRIAERTVLAEIGRYPSPAALNRTKSQHRIGDN